MVTHPSEFVNMTVFSTMCFITHEIYSVGTLYCYLPFFPLCYSLINTWLTSPLEPRHFFVRYCCCCCLATKLSDSFVTPWTVARQPLLSLGFPWQEYWSGLHFLLQGIFLTQGSNSCLLLVKWILYNWSTWEALLVRYLHIFLEAPETIILWSYIKN